MKTKRVGVQPRKEKWTEQPLVACGERKKYTVLLAYPDQGTYEPIEVFMTHTLAKSPADAIEHARKRCIKETKCGEWGDPPGSDLEAIAVFKGWLEDVRT